MGIHATGPGLTQRLNVKIPVTKEPDQLPKSFCAQNTPDNRGGALRYQETTGTATTRDENTIHIQTELRRTTRRDLSGGSKRHGNARSLNVPVAGAIEVSPVTAVYMNGVDGRCLPSSPRVAASISLTADVHRSRGDLPVVITKHKTTGTYTADILRDPNQTGFSSFWQMVAPTCVVFGD